MANFDIKLTPESQKVIDGLVKAGKIDLRPTLNIIGIGYRKEVEQIFDHQQPRNEGLRWAPLSDNPPGKGYASIKARKYPGRALLVVGGQLKESMTKLGARGNISIITKTQGTFGTTVPYGIYHDSDEPRTKLPRRNFSTPSDNRIKIWTDQLTKDIIHNFEVNDVKVEGSIIQ